jgi:hypothetical protein
MFSVVLCERKSVLNSFHPTLPNNKLLDINLGFAETVNTFSGKDSKLFRSQAIKYELLVSSDLL